MLFEHGVTRVRTSPAPRGGDATPQGDTLTDFFPPTNTIPAPGLFATAARVVVQSPEQSHEYKKSSGSSDAAHTYDTTAR